MKELVDSVQELLQLHGALVDRTSQERFEVIAPIPIVQRLGIPEWCRIAAPHDASASDLVLSLESQFFERCIEFARESGVVFSGEYQGSLPARSMTDLKNAVQRQLSFTNATYKIIDCEPASSIYSTVVFRVLLASDDSREDLFLCTMNHQNLCFAPSFGEEAISLLRGSDVICPLDVELPLLSKEGERRLQVGLFGEVKERFSSFLQAMDRRISRDARRIREYYELLVNEAAKIRGNQRTSSAEAKLAATKADYRVKMEDLARKYEVLVKVVPQQVLHLKIPVHRLNVKLLRRKALREIQLDWNPITRAVDKITCEQCSVEGAPFSLRDDTLEMNCGECGKISNKK